VVEIAAIYFCRRICLAISPASLGELSRVGIIIAYFQNDHNNPTNLTVSFECCSQEPKTRNGKQERKKMVTGHFIAASITTRELVAGVT
jgi:hypothetical protein